METLLIYPLFLSALAYGAGGILVSYRWDKALARDWLVSFFRSGLQLGALSVVFFYFIQTPAWKVLIPALFIMLGFSIHALRSRNSVTYWRFSQDAAQVLGLLMLGLILPAVYFGVPAAERENIAQLLPWVGILLGNALSGISLGAHSLMSAFQKNADFIQQELTWGSNTETILKPLQRQALRIAMTPILNSMMVSGVVNIPGVMTGQLIAGVSPFQAVQSQLAILMLVSVAVFAGVLFFSYFFQKQAFTPWRQLNNEIWKQ